MGLILKIVHDVVLNQYTSKRFGLNIRALVLTPLLETEQSSHSYLPAFIPRPPEDLILGAWVWSMMGWGRLQMENNANGNSLFSHPPPTNKTRSNSRFKLLYGSYPAVNDKGTAGNKKEHKTDWKHLNDYEIACTTAILHHATPTSLDRAC